jgi:hypothetical protein
MAIKTFVNTKGQTVAADPYGSWKVYNPATGKFGAYAQGPQTQVPDAAPAGTAPAATHKPAEAKSAPEPVATKREAAAPAKKSSLGTVVLAAVLILALAVGSGLSIYYYNASGSGQDQARLEDAFKKLPPAKQDQAAPKEPQVVQNVAQDVCETRTLPAGFTDRDAQKYGMSRVQYLERLLEDCDAQGRDTGDYRTRVAGNVIAPHLALGFTQRRGRLHYRSGWSSEDDSNLDEMLARKSQHVLRGLPAKRNHQGFIGEQAHHKPLPPGCREFKRRSDGEMFVRVVCN